MKPVVFAGPSLAGASADLLEGIELRPPARKGDLLAAHLQGARVIGLVDGVFDLCPSVWHKEILFALSEGSAVYGAASLGALRAAECALFGMVGVGRIYEDYAGGRRVADADVALVHAPAELGHMPLTLPLADIETAVAESDLDAATAAMVLARARALNFRERSLDAFDAGVRAVLGREETSQKRRDALALLDAVRRHRGPGPGMKQPFAGTVFFAALMRGLERADP